MASVRTDTDGKPLAKPSLKRALWRAIFYKVYPYWLGVLLKEIARMISPIFLALLLQSINDCAKEATVCSDHPLYNTTNITNTTLSTDCADAINTVPLPLP